MKPKKKLLFERKQVDFIPRKNDNVKTKIIPAKNVKASINASYFVQGLFFGHEAEIKKFTIGNTTAEYSPSKSKVLQTKKWKR